jgi:hypothetical protein
MTIYSGTFSATSNYPNPGNWTGSLSFNLQPDGFGDFVGSGTIKVSYVDTASIPITPNFTASDTEQVIGYTNVAAGYDEFMPNFYPGASTGEFDGNFTNSTDSTITGTLILTYAPTDNTFETKVTLYGQPSLPPVISFDSGSLEINANAGVATYTLSRSFVPLGDLGSTVHVSTRNGTAVAGRDYGAINDKAVIFGPGQTTATFTVPISADAADAEAGINPDFEIVLSNPVNASIGLGTADTTILETSLTVNNIGSATRGQVIPLSSLVVILDPSNAGYQQLELWDSNGTAATGQFVVNGVPQSGGHEIDVSPANVANTVFDVGALGGTDTLRARLKQNGGTLTPWEKFTVTAPVAQLPTLAVHNDSNATRGQVVDLSTLVTISDPDHVGYQQLELWDSAGTVASGRFVVDGVAQGGGVQINVAPANVANTVFDVGTAGGTDTLYARLLQDNGTLTAWQKFTVTAPAVPLPTLSVRSDADATGGQVIALSSLVTIADPNNVGYEELELWDSHGTVTGGEFKINGAAQGGGVAIDVSPANVANVVFDAGTWGGSDTLEARLLQNNGKLTAWQKFTVTVPSPTLSVHNDSGATPSEVIPLSTLVTIADPGNVGYLKLELWDSNGTAAKGQFVVDGAAQTGGHAINVAPGDVANTVFDVGTTGATDTLEARLEQDNGTLTAWQKFTVKDPLTVAAGATLEVASAYAGAVSFAGSTGTLQLDASSAFSGSVAGMTGQDGIDLRSINYATVHTPSYSGTSSGGTLTATDGTHSANIALLGSYLAATFLTSSDGYGGTLVSEEPAQATHTQIAPGHA